MAESEWDFLDDLPAPDLAQTRPETIIARFRERSPAELQDMLAELDTEIDQAHERAETRELVVTGLKVLRTVVKAAMA